MNIVTKDKKIVEKFRLLANINNTGVKVITTISTENSINKSFTKQVKDFNTSGGTLYLEIQYSQSPYVNWESLSTFEGSL